MRGIWSLKNEISRSVALNKESITAVDLRIFGDASITASCGVVYSAVHQQSVTNQGLVVSKSRISKKTSIIPRLELVSVHIIQILNQHSYREVELNKSYHLSS